MPKNFVEICKDLFCKFFQKASTECLQVQNPNVITAIPDPALNPPPGQQITEPPLEEDIPNKLSLEGKIVLVVGGSKGIGKATALRLSQAGACVISTSRHPEKYCDVCFLSDTPLDVTSEDSVKNFFDCVIKPVGCLDIIVNSAGVAWMGPSSPASGNELTEYLNLMISGNQRVVFYGLKYMQRANTRVVTLGALNSELTMFLAGPYSIAKRALQAWNDNYNIEIRVLKSLGFICDGPTFTLLEPTFVQTSFGFYEYYFPNKLEPDNALVLAEKAIQNYLQIKGMPAQRVADAIYRIVISPQPGTRYFIAGENDTFEIDGQPVTFDQVLQFAHTLPADAVLNFEAQFTLQQILKSPFYAEQIACGQVNATIL